jgi:hypothetical protein
MGSHGGLLGVALALAAMSSSGRHIGDVHIRVPTPAKERRERRKKTKAQKQRRKQRQARKKSRA